MKRTGMILLILTAGAVAFAASTATMEDGQNSASANIPMTLNLTEEGTFNKVVIGFSSTEVSDYSDVQGLDSYALAPDNNTGIATNDQSKELHVFYQIQSAQNLIVTLYAEDALDNSGNKIYFDVTGVKDTAAGESGGSESKVFVNGVTDDGKKEGNPAGYGSAITAVNVVDHNPLEKVGNVGSYELTIKTEDYRSKPMGEYSANLIVKVEVDGSATGGNS